jgi:hypothetical protein
MLSLLKKNPDGASDAKPWRPNFRNPATLPDTKVVRTSFFINLISAIAALALLLLVGYQEYNLADLRSQIAVLDFQIANDTKPSRDAVALYGKFQAEEKKIREVDDFLKGSKAIFSRFLDRIGQTVPPRISVTMLDVGANGATIRGFVDGTPEQASGMISAYEIQLREDEEIGRRFDTISLTNLSRDQQNGRLTYEISLRKNSKTEAKKK